jgi:hypothetical protein
MSEYNIKWTSTVTGLEWYSKPTKPFTHELAKEILASGQTEEVKGEIVPWSESQIKLESEFLR